MGSGQPDCNIGNPEVQKPFYYVAFFCALRVSVVNRQAVISCFFLSVLSVVDLFGCGFAAPGDSVVDSLSLREDQDQSKSIDLGHENVQNRLNALDGPYEKELYA